MVTQSMMESKDSDQKEVTFDLPSEDPDTESGFIDNGDISESKTSLSSDSSSSHINGSHIEISQDISHINGETISEVSSPVSLQPNTSTPLPPSNSSSRERLHLDRSNMIARLKKKKKKDNSSKSSSSGSSPFDSQQSVTDHDPYLPEQIKVPIVGFEVMEERSRFTVFKIQVNVSTSRGNWFVFRRYSDFTHLNMKLKKLFPGLRLALPPKRWFKDNFDRNFLEDRMLGLQAFSDNVTGHEEIKRSKPVREFFCLDEPPGPHDSLEESRAHCDELEDTVYSMRKIVSEKDSEIKLLQDELNLYKSQVEMLSKALRERNSSILSVESISSEKSNLLAESDIMTQTEVDQSEVTEKSNEMPDTNQNTEDVDS